MRFSGRSAESVPRLPLSREVVARCREQCCFAWKAAVSDLWSNQLGRRTKADKTIAYRQVGLDDGNPVAGPSGFDGV